MSKRSANFAGDFSVGVRQPSRKRQRLIRNNTNVNINPNTYKYIPPNAQTLRAEFEDTISAIDEVCPRASNLESLISEWNERMNDLGVCNNMLNNNNMSYLVSRLDAEDFELMKQITSLSKETLHYAHSLRTHSEKCTDIMLNKLQQRKSEKRNQVNLEKMERDQIRIPSKDIWCHNERINYFREGSKAAIKTQVFNTKLQCLENKFIVTKIIGINHSQQQCLLIDDADNEKKEYTQSFKNIMCLPSLSVVALVKRNIFKAGQRCLAVYPSTTCFYKAKIIKPPKLLYKQTKYSLKFDDDGDKIKEIEAENVMPYVT